MRFSRRRLFRLLAGGPGMVLAAEDHFKRNLIIRSARPEDLEMPLEGFSTWITPVERFFVRSHLYRPEVDLAAWRLHVGGLVQNPLALDMAELKKFPRASLVSVLECAGNGRGFFRPAVPGAQWRYGAVGNARWTGVRLADILRKAGLKPEAKEILFNGADVPMGTVPDFIRSVPLHKALHPDTLLAFEMNGQPLPPAHGFPLRLVVPGWAGDSWIKWVTEIQALDREYDGFFMKTAYRRPERPATPGTAVDPARMAPVQSIRPKSVIASPVDGQKFASGPVTLRGAAWAGESPLARVDVSMDNGRTWAPAKLGADGAGARYCWRLWEATWNPPPEGSYVLMARAADVNGDTQPLVQEWNPSGYLWNVVQQVRVEVGAANPATPVETPAPIPPFSPQLKAACAACHGEDIIAGQSLTRAQWERELDKMIRWGAQVPPGDRPAILDFLADRFGPKR